MAKKSKDDGSPASILKGGPKRPASSFILFGKDIRERDENVKKMSITEQAGYIGKKWKEATEDQKAKFNKQAEELKKKYNEERKKFEESDEYKKAKAAVKESASKGKRKMKEIIKETPGYKLFKSESEKVAKGEKSTGDVIAEKWSKLTSAAKKEYEDRAKQASKAINSAKE